MKQFIKIIKKPINNYKNKKYLPLIQSFILQVKILRALIST